MGGTLLAAARAHAGLGTRRVRARARAPRLQPSARSRLRCHSQLPGAAASPGSGAVSAGPAPLALSQEEELKEDAWAREYSGGGPIGSGAQAKDGPGAEPLPAGASAPWPRVAASDPRLGQPLPQPTAEGGRAPVSRGAGREPPPVRLETVATATGLRSPATRLQGGDAPSPTSRGAASQGRRERGTLPLAVGGTSPLWPCQDVPASTAVEGGGGGRSAPWARAGSHVATVVAAGLLGWQQTWGRPSHWACHGRRRQGSGVRTPPHQPPTPSPIPLPYRTHRQRNGLP